MGSVATASQQEVEEALAGLVLTIEIYLQTALAKAILDQVLDDGGRGSDDLIERAFQLFAHLTSGEFTAIGMEQVEQTTVAFAERSAAAGGGGRLFIPSLSDGTSPTRCQDRNASTDLLCFRNLLTQPHPER